MEHLPQIHRFGPYEFSPAHLELRLGDERKPLTKSMNRLLLLLVSRPGEVVTREQIADTLWSEQGTVDVANGINTAINRLRSIIGDNNGHGVFIETVVGTGYRFTASVEAITPSSITPLHDVTATPETSPSHTRIAIVASGLLLLTLGGLTWAIRHHHSASSPGENHVYRMEAVTAEDPADELSQQVISPSGGLLAYRDVHGVFLKTLANNAIRRLDLPVGLNVASLSWYPDETALLVTGNTIGATNNGSSTDELWRLSLAGEAPQLLLPNAELATVSPDGAHIAFLRAGKTEVWLTDAKGHAPHRLIQTSNGDTLHYMLWAPDSKRLITNRMESDLAKLPVGTNETQQRSPSPSASYYESFDANTGARLASAAIHPFESAVLLQDGTLYYNTTPTASEGQQLGVVQTDTATGALRSSPRSVPNSQMLSSEFRGVEQLSASSDGNTISAILNRVATHTYVADLVFHGKNKPSLEHVTLLSRHTFNTLPIEWTRDGKMILSDEGLGDPISVVGEMLDGTPAKFLVSSHDGQHYAQGQHSADGQWLLFLHIYPGGRRTIERIPANGGTPQPIPIAGNASDFRCSTSPAGRCAVRVLEEDKSILYYELDPAHGTGAILARTGWQRTVLGDWSISPDGQAIVVADHDPAHPGVDLLPLNGKPPRQIPVTGYGTVLGAAWTADGHAFFIHTSDPTGYSLLYMTERGDVSFLRKSPDILWAIHSPDGKRVVFPENTQSNRNVWVGTLGRSSRQ